MQLSRVRVRNFRNFEDLTIDPFPSPAVIVGENGVGKSNLLAALRLVLDPDLLDRHRVLGSDDIRDGGPTLAQGVEVCVEVDLSGFDDDLDARSVLDGAKGREFDVVPASSTSTSPTTDSTASPMPNYTLHGATFTSH